MFNKVQLVTFPHVVLSAYLTGAAFVVGIGFWSMLRKGASDEDRGLHRLAVRTAAVVVLVAGLGVAVTGDVQGKVMTEVQPMKMAAAEGLYDTTDHAPFSVLTIGRLDGSSATNIIELPGLLSFLGTGTFDGEVQGINQLRREYQRTYGQDPGATYYSAGDYTPVIPITYWSFRLMIGLGLAAAAAAGAILIGTRRGRVPSGRAWVWLALSLPLLPLAANSFGWIFTEMGRQPWAVFGVMTTAQAVSPGVSAAQAATSLIALTLLYAVLMVIEVRLMLTYVRRGAEPFHDPHDDADDDLDRPLAFAY
jgi:cytochrome d ubiquinol oxidase subunit I